MSNPFVAEIRMFAGNFAPTGWATCDGQLLPISQNTALFSLLGTFYGGDGKSTFALLDLEGSAPLGQGQLKGGSEYFLGQSSGTDTVTLLVSEMPVHNHNLNAHTPDNADLLTPTPTSSNAGCRRISGITILPTNPVPQTTTRLAISLSSLSCSPGSKTHSRASSSGMKGPPSPFSTRNPVITAWKPRRPQ